MSALGPWLLALIAIVALWVDIPHHRFDAPFGCPGICMRIGDKYYFQEIKTHLGLDLQGGTQLVLRLETEKLPPGSTTPLDVLNEQARKVIDRRINSLGVSEPVIQAFGGDKILVELPGVADIDQAQKVATQTAFLEFKVPDEANPEQYKSLQPPLTGQNLKPTFVSFAGQAQSNPVVNFEFGSPDDQRWVDLSKQYVGKQVEILLDQKRISAPSIREVFSSGKGIIQSTRVEPTLGADSVQRSLIAGAVGLLLVGFFMVAYYRLPGALAVIALLYYTALVYALFRLVPVTLTLAGIAGFILSIGDRKSVV